MKKAAGIFITISLFLVTFAASARAQTPQQTQRWVCLDAVSCMVNPAACSAAAKGDGHKAKLSTKQGFEPIPGQPTYVVVCLATDKGQICTTGNATADNTVYGKSNVDELKASIGYQFEGLFKADGTTSVANPATWAGPYEWGDAMTTGHIHTWFAMNYWDPNNAATGEQGGQQQGTFDFETAEKDCIKIAWDPFGRVFDAGTLEPITGARVTLEIKKGENFKKMTPSDLMGGSLTNPQTTLEDGGFSFVVPDGTYRLTSAPVPVTALTDVDVNYAKAYSDIYPAGTGEEIQQKGGLQHRDIAVATQNTNTSPKLMQYFYTTNSRGTLVIEGVTSHPLTKINVKTSKVMVTAPTTKVPYRTVGTFQADKYGKFRIEVDQSKFEKTDEYVEVFSDVELVKVDLKAPVSRSFFQQVLGFVSGFVKPVEAASATTTIPFEPIPQYLEGYAYDAAGKAIPNAKVGVYLTFSNAAYSQTTADENGFFKMTSEFLPGYPFELRYTTAAGGTVKVKTSAFLAQNEKYLVDQKINPYIGRTLKNQVAPTVNPEQLEARRTGGSSSVGMYSSVRTRSQDKVEKKAPEAAANPTSYTGYIIILVVTLLVLGGVGIWLITHLKKAHTGGPSDLPPPQGVM